MTSRLSGKQSSRSINVSLSSDIFGKAPGHTSERASPPVVLSRSTATTQVTCGSRADISGVREITC
jgi:hypothetical protein